MVATSPSYRLVTSQDELEAVATRVISDGTAFGFDIETGYDGEPREGAALHPEENFVCGISFTNSVHWGVYVPLRHDTGTNLGNRQAAATFWSLLATGLGVAHGAKFELRCLARWFAEQLSEHPLFGEAVRRTAGYFPIRSDTMIERYIEAAYESSKQFGDEIGTEAGLKQLTLAAAEHQMTELLELFPADLTDKQKKAIRFNVLDQHDPAVYAYAGEDSVWCLWHHLDCFPRVGTQFLYRVEMQILYLLCEMEDYGVRYDWNFMRDGAARGRTFKEKMQFEVVHDLNGLLTERGAEPVRIINLNSPPQLSKVLFEQLGMRTTVLTKGGKDGKGKKMSTGKIALKGLSKRYPAVKKILNWKNLSRLIGTYLEKYERAYTYAGDGMTHPNHMQCAVISGRFAVGGPPYQQSPKKYHYDLADKSSFDFNFRDAIIAPDGHYILGFDYSQIELRVIAGEAEETALLEAFANGEDVHCKTAALMLGKSLEDVTEEDRAIGKTMNFALMYQMGVDGLAERLGVTLEEAEELFTQYFAAYPRIKMWIDRTVAQSKMLGYTTSRLGRRHPIWEYGSSQRFIYAKGERLAGNVPIQGGAADYMKVAMVRADKALKEAGLKDCVHLVMNIHDALEFYVRDDIPPKRVIDVLSPAIIFPVQGWPAMEAEWHAGRRWGSVKVLVISEDGNITVKEEETKQAQVVGVDWDEEDAQPVLAVDPDAVRGALGYALQGTGRASGVSDMYEEMENADDAGYSADLHVAAAVPAAQDSPAGPAKVLITVDEMPTSEEYGRLLGLVAAAPGLNTLVMRTPQGEVEVSKATAIAPSMAAQVSLVLGGAEVVYAPESVDTSALVSGLEM